MNRSFRDVDDIARGRLVLLGGGLESIVELAGSLLAIQIGGCTTRAILTRLAKSQRRDSVAVRAAEMARRLLAEAA